MAKQALKFSRTAPTEKQFARILASKPRGITVELADAAGELVREEARKLRFSEPRLDFVDALTRLAAQFPSAFQVLFAATKTNLVSVEQTEDEYVAEET